MSLFTIAGNDTEHAQWCTDHRPAAHALAARPTREMTLDCRTLWSVRFCAAKGHFCSLLLSNILVTSAFCRLTISPIFFHSTFPVFSLLSLSAGCSYRLEFLSIDKPPCRFFWNLWNSLFFDYSQQLYVLTSFQKKRWKEILLLWKVLSFCDYIVSRLFLIFKPQCCTIYLIFICTRCRFQSL